MSLIYLDNNATTRPADSVVDAVREALSDDWGNPSSVHRFGQAARRRLELSRDAVATLLGSEPREVVFTGCGSESINLAVHGSLAQRGRSVLVTSRIEHAAMREVAEAAESRGDDVIWLPNDTRGIVDAAALEDVLERRAGEIALVSIMWANNETGVVQDVETLGRLCRAHDVRFHTDGTQWVGRMPVDIAALPVDLMSFSAHKLHGPKGVGALFVRRGTRIAPHVIGGPHERGLRGGTENVSGIAGFGEAARLATRWLAGDGRQAQTRLRDEFEHRVLEAVDDTAVNGVAARRLWNTSNIAFPGLEAEPILLMLSERGVCASAGAACSSGSLDPSPVLKAMDIPERLALGSIRFSISRETTAEELDQAVKIIAEVIARLRRSTPV